MSLPNDGLLIFVFNNSQRLVYYLIAIKIAKNGACALSLYAVHDVLIHLIVTFFEYPQCDHFLSNKTNLRIRIDAYFVSFSHTFQFVAFFSWCK